MKSGWVLSFIITALVAVQSATAQTSSSDQNALQQRVEQLEQTVKHLKQHIDELQSGHGSQVSPVVATHQ